MLRALHAFGVTPVAMQRILDGDFPDCCAILGMIDEQVVTTKSAKNP